MKRISLVIAFLLLLGFPCTGCDKQERAIITDSSYGPSSESEVVSSLTESPVAGIEDAIERYCALYHAEYVYCDVIVPQKALLIAEKQIIELTVFSSYEQTKIIERSSVVRVENIHIDMFEIVNIYDKTNQFISVMVEPGMSDEIAILLK